MIGKFHVDNIIKPTVVEEVVGETPILTNIKYKYKPAENNNGCIELRIKELDEYVVVVFSYYSDMVCDTTMYYKNGNNKYVFKFPDKHFTMIRAIKYMKKILRLIDYNIVYKPWNINYAKYGGTYQF